MRGRRTEAGQTEITTGEWKDTKLDMKFILTINELPVTHRQKHSLVLASQKEHLLLCFVIEH